MRIVFMGTPEFAVPTLDALVEAGHDVIAAYAQPARPGGRRGRELVPSPIQRRAEALGIAVRTPISLRTPEEQAAFALLDAQIAVVAAYGLILPREVLETPPFGCLNVHGSLLPRWRGAAPIQRAILAGDAETGVGIMQMESGLDTGPVRLEGRATIAGKTAGDLTAELAVLGARLMMTVLGDLAAYPAVAQVIEGVTYAAKVAKAEMRLDFAQPAEAVERQVRAFNPPGAWFALNGERVRVLNADVDDAIDAPAGIVVDDALTLACATGAIRPVSVQRAGRGVMTVEELLRGFPIPAGMRL